MNVFFLFVFMVIFLWNTNRTILKWFNEEELSEKKYFMFVKTSTEKLPINDFNNLYEYDIMYFGDEKYGE